MTFADALTATPLTPTLRRRVKDALCETERFIEKEGARNPALRPADVQKHLDFCVGHAAKLRSVLGG